MYKVPDRPSELGITTQDGKDEWREGQKDAIGEIISAFKDKKFVLCNAPTGSGKTIIGAAVGRILGVDSLSLMYNT